MGENIISRPKSGLRVLGVIMVEDALIKWGLVAIMAAFVVIAAMTWWGFQRYRKNMDDIEQRLAKVQSDFVNAAQITGELDVLRKSAVSSSDFESAMADLTARIFRKSSRTVVKRHG